MVVAGCGGGSSSATGSGNAAAPTTTALTATTPAPKLFSSDFEGVCGGATVSRATPHDNTKPTGHELMYFADFQESGLVEQSSGVPSDWTLLFDANADAFTAIDLVACAQRGEATFVKDCDGYEKDKQPTQNVVKMYDATYAVSVREATTGKELAATSIAATSATCPMIGVVRRNQRHREELRPAQGRRPRAVPEAVCATRLRGDAAPFCGGTGGSVRPARRRYRGGQVVCPAVPPSRFVSPVGRRRVRLFAFLAVVAAVVVVLSGCQVKAAVNITVAEDGSGTVVAAVGLDGKARERLGNPDDTIMVSDLRAGGWTVDPAVTDADGLTWLRATKPFDRPEAAASVLGELTGSDGAFREMSVVRDESLGLTTWSLRGSIDLAGGMAAFAEPELAPLLDGEPVLPLVSSIERAEGRKAADMIDVSVTVTLPDAAAKTFNPRVGDPNPTKLDVTSERRSALGIPLGSGASGGIGSVVLVGGVVAGGIGLVVLRQRFRAVGR